MEHTATTKEERDRAGTTYAWYCSCGGHRRGYEYRMQADIARNLHAVGRDGVSALDDRTWLADTMARQYVAGRTTWEPEQQSLIEEFPDEWQAAIDRARAKALAIGDVVVEGRRDV